MAQIYVYYYVHLRLFIFLYACVFLWLGRSCNINIDSTNPAACRFAASRLAAERRFAALKMQRQQELRDALNALRPLAYLSQPSEVAAQSCSPSQRPRSSSAGGTPAALAYHRAGSSAGGATPTSLLTYPGYRGASPAHQRPRSSVGGTPAALAYYQSSGPSRGDTPPKSALRSSSSPGRSALASDAPSIDERYARLQRLEFDAAAAPAASSAPLRQRSGSVGRPPAPPSASRLGRAGSVGRRDPLADNGGENGTTVPGAGARPASSATSRGGAGHRRDAAERFATTPDSGAVRQRAESARPGNAGHSARPAAAGAVKPPVSALDLAAAASPATPAAGYKFPEAQLSPASAVARLEARIAELERRNPPLRPPQAQTPAK